MSNSWRLIGAALLCAAVPAVSQAQTIYPQPVYRPPPPPPPRIAYYTPSGTIGFASGPPVYVVPPTRYSFYEVPSPVGVYPTTTLYYPAAPAGAPVFVPGNFAPGVIYTPGYYNGYPTKQFYRY
jgi:hypothetical protein